MNLSIAAWKGERHYRTSYWLRFWDADGNLLPWATEKLEQDQQQIQAERQRANRLAQRLRDLGLDPDVDD